MARSLISIVRDRRGAIAVEFAFIAPVLVLMIVAILAFGSIIGIHNGLQQLVAEAARASVGGLSNSERDTLARGFVAANAAAYPFIDPAQLTLSTTPTATTFKVSATYDMSNAFAYRLGTGLVLPSPLVTRTSVVVLGEP